MQEVLINIEDYLDHDEIKEMVRCETTYAIREKVNHALSLISVSDIIYNVAHKIVIQILKEQEVDLHQKIAEKTLECIDELSIYYVLRNDDNGEKSKAQQVLDECVEEARPKIQEKINEIIEDKLNADWLINEVVDAFYNKLHEQLVG
jgi:hypothetical protein